MDQAEGPPSESERGLNIARLIDIMRRLRDPVSGCEWDTVQSFETIAPYTIEEAYEVADAIARKDMAGVALALPALERAVKLQRRAARTGFDWPDAEGARAKIHEELAELDAETEPARQEEELGDLLFAVVNLARFLKIEPEEALRKANRKFEKRFRAIEQEPGFADLDLDDKERLWVAAKRAQAE